MWPDDEPDIQDQNTDRALLASPEDWIKEGYTLEQKLKVPRGSLFETRLEASSVLRGLGNEFYESRDYEKALDVYERAFWHVDFEHGYVSIEMTEQHQLQLYEVQIPVRLNLARCRLALQRDVSGARQQVETSLKLCDQYPSIDRKAKALFLRAKINLESAGSYDEALADLISAAKLEPNDRAIRAAISEVKDQRRHLKADQKALFEGKLVGSVAPGPQRKCVLS